jgi:mannan endo-1,4-beta-mannosidase
LPIENYYKNQHKMTRTSKFFLLVTFAFVFVTSTLNAQYLKPVNPNATPEAVALYEYIQSISGKKILAGQHCAPLEQSLQLSVDHRVTGHYPVVFGQDFGFSYPGYWDGINYRQRIVDEAIVRHSQGFIITLMWHAVPPTMDEPMEFKEAIQSEVSDADWNEMITPGTRLNERWKSQVDVVAWFLKQLKYANVPVIWRPYHEMNGAWFWWGQKKGDNGYKKLYRMMYDRFVNFHGLDNLLWVYNCNEEKPGVDSYETYYPGNDVVDILATDVYSQGYDQMNYDHMVKLAGKKPIALGEIGKYPSPEILEKQPLWAWFMAWGGPESFGNNPADVTKIFKHDRVLTLDELPWVKVKEPRLHYPVLK